MKGCAKWGSSALKSSLLNTLRIVDLPSSTPFGQYSLGRSQPSSSLTIRAAQGSDLIHMADLLAESFHSRSGLMSWFYPLFRLGIYEDLRNRLRQSSSNFACLVAIETHPTLSTPAVVGTVELGTQPPSLWEFRQAQNYLYVSNLAIKPDWRRRGIAQKLLLSCEDTALAWGYRDLFLHVLEKNHAARNLYAKLGYRIEQTEASWDSWLLGRSRRLFLHKALTANRG